MIGIFVRLYLKFKTNKVSRRGFPIKALLMLQRSIRVKGLLPSPKRGKVVDLSKVPRCPKYDKRHDGKLLVGTDNCYGCGKSGQMERDCTMMKSHRRENT